LCRRTLFEGQLVEGGDFEELLDGIVLLLLHELANLTEQDRRQVYRDDWHLIVLVRGTVPWRFYTSCFPKTISDFRKTICQCVWSFPCRRRTSICRRIPVGSWIRPAARPRPHETS